MAHRVLHISHAVIATLSISLSPGAAAAAAEAEAPHRETGDSVETVNISGIAAVTLQERRTIAVEVHLHWPYPPWLKSLKFVYLESDDSIVVSIGEESNPDSRWEIVAMPPRALNRIGEVREVSVESIHADSVVLLSCEEMYRIHCTSIKVFFDAEAKKALGRVEIKVLGKSTLLEVNNAVYAVTELQEFGGNRSDDIVARYLPEGPVLVSDSERIAVIAALPKPRPECRHTFKNPILEGGVLDGSATPLTRPSCFEQLRISPPLWKYVLDRNNDHDLRGIALQEGNSYRAYALPRTTPIELAQHRPHVVARYPRYLDTNDQSWVLEWMGASVLRTNRLWFGKSFYEGEGRNGVGSFGYFDIDERSYSLTTIPEIADWSTSAIFVDEGLVWIGLTHYTEGADSSGGLLRYDQETGETRIYPIENVITHILGHNDVIYVGAKRGRLYALKNGSIVSRHSVEPSLEGGFEIRSLIQTR